MLKAQVQLVKDKEKKTQLENATPKVKEFLDAKGRNSAKSVLAYLSALEHLKAVILLNYPKYNIENIIEVIIKGKIDVYSVLNEYVGYLIKRKVTPKSIKAYISGIKSYFGYYDVDIIPNKFQKKVVMPRVNRIEEEALESSDIRRILLACSNRRLKAYLLVLASSGLRAVEALSIRNKDINFDIKSTDQNKIDFSSSPTVIKIRAEYTKTRTERIVYISDEATHYVKQWLDFKYRSTRRIPREFSPEDLTFTFAKNANPVNLYPQMWGEFLKLLTLAKLNERKRGETERRTITLHSLRRFVYTTICDAADQAYAEWFLGHAKSVYHTKKEAAKREIYANKIMKYLTYLDYSKLESAGRSVEAQLDESQRELTALRKRDADNVDRIAKLEENQQMLLQSLIKAGLLKPTAKS